MKDMTFKLKQRKKWELAKQKWSSREGKRRSRHQTHAEGSLSWKWNRLEEQVPWGCKWWVGGKAITGDWRWGQTFSCKVKVFLRNLVFNSMKESCLRAKRVTEHSCSYTGQWHTTFCFVNTPQASVCREHWRSESGRAGGGSFSSPRQTGQWPRWSCVLQQHTGEFQEVHIKFKNLSLR